MLGLDKDSVKLSKYSSNWKKEYEKEEEKLSRILKDYVLDIQHVGSTSIIGLSAKPIIDITVAVKDIETLKVILPILTNHGYDMLDSIDEKGEILARKGTPSNRTHYIHIEVINSNYWTNHILFRDYLLKYPYHIKEYEELKQKLSLLYKDDRKKYTAEKSEYISNIINLAKEEFLHK